MYGVPPGTANTNIAQYGQPFPGSHGYTSIQGYMTPGRPVLQYGGPRFSGATTETIATIQAPYPTGIFSLSLSVYSVPFLLPSQFTNIFTLVHVSE